MSDRLTEEDLAALGVSAAPASSFACPECDFVATSNAGLAQHRRKHRAPAKAGQRDATPAPAGLVVEEVVGRAVANLQVIGGYLAIVLPHTGIAIAGVPNPESTERKPLPDIVQSRARMAANVLRQWAEKDARVLAAMDRFNRLFETTEIVEVAAGIGAAVAVDVAGVDPHLALEVGPFRGENAIRPVEAVIGDVVQYVDAIRAQQEAQAGPEPRRESPDGRAPDGAEIVSGGMEDT